MYFKITEDKQCCIFMEQYHQSFTHGTRFMPYQEKKKKHWCLFPHQFTFGISILFILAGCPIPAFSCSHSEEYFVNLDRNSPEAACAHCLLSVPSIFVRRVGWTDPIPSAFLHVPSSPSLSSSPLDPPSFFYSLS